MLGYVVYTVYSTNLWQGGAKMKKFIVLCLIISIMMTPIAEAYSGDTEGDFQQTLKGTVIVIAAIAAIFVLVKVHNYLTSPPRFDTQEEVDAYVKEHGYPVNPGNAYLYENNYYSVLSWAKVGMDESVIREKVGGTGLQSTYSSMGYTVNVYKFSSVHSPDGRYIGSVWLTFINGKLDSISTFE